MPSSWRWTTNDEFIEYVEPHSLNEVNNVRNYQVFHCFAEACRDLFENVDTLRTSLESLEKWLETHKLVDDEALAIANDICWNGEHMLLFQRRLAVGMGAYSFLHGKGGIERATHKPGKPTGRYALERLCKDTRQLLAAFDEALSNDAKFLVDDVRGLPEHLKDDFRTARDLSSVGFEDVALIVCGRGFEKVVRAVLDARAISITGSKVKVPASKAMLNDLIGAMGRMSWQDDGSRVFSPQSVSLMQWIREVRNGSVHEGEEDVAADERATATILAQVTARLWEMHTKNLGRELNATELQKNW